MKGFAWIPVVVIVALIVLGAGWYAHSHTSAPVPVATATTTDAGGSSAGTQSGSQSSGDTTAGAQHTVPAYTILTPAAGSSIAEDSPITVTWQRPATPSNGVDIYLVSDTCTQEPCDQVYAEETENAASLPRLMKEYADDTGSYTISLPTLSPATAYSQGKYRIVLKRGSEVPSGRTLLAVSGAFSLTTPKSGSQVSVGEKIGDFTVVSATPYTLQTVGTTTVRGFYWEPDGVLGGADCFRVIADDAAKLPRPGIDDRGAFFCFDNADSITSELRNSTGTTTIQIANYKVDMSPKETTDLADFVRVVH